MTRKAMPIISIVLLVVSIIVVIIKPEPEVSTVCYKHTNMINLLNIIAEITIIASLVICTILSLILNKKRGFKIVFIFFVAFVLVIPHSLIFWGYHLHELDVASMNGELCDNWRQLSDVEK